MLGMGLASKALTILMGPMFKVLVIPALFIGSLTLGKIAWDKRDARIMREGELVCTIEWEKVVREQEKRTAELRLGVVQSILEHERKTAGALTDENNRIKGELDALRATAGTDGKCLSDGVLDALRKRQSSASKTGAGKGSGSHRPK